ncbi:MAG: IS1 family transposase [Chitinophagaceae bacterium]|nr:IS1 family transposase [Chitinophagaceae bacterium]
MKCPKCGHLWRVKDGIVKGKQRYKCLFCGFRFSVNYKAGIHPSYRRLALLMHLEGLSLERIARSIGVSPVAILKWIRAYKVDESHVRGNAEIVNELKIDELSSYIIANQTSASKWVLIELNTKGYSSFL